MPFRALRREPRFAIVAVLILAVGIGACTAMFSIVHAVLLRPMALPNAARVVMLWSIDVRHDAVIESTYETEADFRAPAAVVRRRCADGLGQLGRLAHDRRAANLCTSRQPAVSGTFFQVLGSARAPRAGVRRKRRRPAGGTPAGAQPRGVDAILRRRSVRHRPEGHDARGSDSTALRSDRRDASGILLPARRSVPGRPRRRGSRRSPVIPDSRAPTCSASLACSTLWGD